MTDLSDPALQGVLTGAAGTRLDTPEGVLSIGADDRQYEDLSLRSSNRRFTPRPTRFELPTDTAQVVDAVRRAVRAGHRLTVRSGGHCYENFVSAEDIHTVIDLSQFTGVRFDPVREAFEVAAGTPILDLYRSLFYRWGVTVPAGSCGSVAAGGHIVGGAYGPLSRSLGLAIDYLEAVEVVVVDGHGEANAVLASRNPDDPNHDLWWAHTGGGGGNFGIVTRYWFRDPNAFDGAPPRSLLPAPPSSLLSSTVAWMWDGMDRESHARIIRNHGEWHERNSAPGSAYAGLYGGLVMFGRADGDDPGVAFFSFAQMDASGPDGRGLLDEYVAAVSAGVTAPPMESPYEQSPFMALTEKYARLQETPGLRLKLRDAFLRRRFTDPQLDVIFDWLSDTTGDHQGASLSLQSYGCEINRVPPHATASVHRDSIFQALFYATWEDEKDDVPRADWLRRFYQAVYAGTGGVPVLDDDTDGCFINFPDTDLLDPQWNSSTVPWSELYYGANYPRLQQIKKTWDPRGVFGHALGVQAAQ